MKRFLLCLAATALLRVAHAADVDVAISVGPPIYGPLDLGGYPQPVLVYPQPVLVERVPVGVVRQPMYVHVPPGHAKHWAKHCHRYNACGAPVYFVQEDWYRTVYAPRYYERHPGKGHGKGHKHDRD